MATTIRLKRVGAKKQASYRIVVTDRREGTSGASIERLGVYNPRTRPSSIRIDGARALHWLREGAEPSATVRSLFRKTGLWKQFHDGVTPEALEEAEIFLGPPPGERATSQRPMPTERAPAGESAEPAAAEDAEEPSPQERAEAAAAEEDTVAPEALETSQAEVEEAGEESVAEVEEDAAEAEAETKAEAEPAEEGATAEAEEEATAEAEEETTAEAEAEEDEASDEEDEETS